MTDPVWAKYAPKLIKSIAQSTLVAELEQAILAKITINES